MKIIDAKIIDNLLSTHATADPARVDSVLDKARALQRLSLEETAVLMAADDAASTEKIFDTAADVKNTVYGRRVVLFAPLYISNRCMNNCSYCGFKTDNTAIKRISLTCNQIDEQVKYLLSRGHKRILMVTGEAASVNGKANIDYYTESIAAIYAAKVGPHAIKRVNINCAPLNTVNEFKKLKAAGIGTYQLFQETYHDATYRSVHLSGPKGDPDKRLDAIDLAFEAGIDDVGLGVLYGLYDYKFETLALMQHIEHLENKFNIGPHTISVPRIEPAEGADFTNNIPHAVSDQDFARLIAILRLAVPYTGLILSTRETAQARDRLINLGVSQISAESCTSPGGYGHEDTTNTQFALGDHRTLDQIIGSLISQKLLPSFCAACYRMDRTGENFMEMAKPGTIKGKCQLNGLVTLKEYIDDFASDEVKESGYKLIDEFAEHLDENTRQVLDNFFTHIAQGTRDEYV
ncbi:MAG: [FeFe] hydrogenase H-cluster radical SAM maturase HydG [Anaerohalosphaera sp.]|nr:[FeFe] hydrogenase H-cluster radical SAM maturase HydG [Anaerohalosphaera sp.]